jgi:hypothetical protein
MVEPRDRVVTERLRDDPDGVGGLSQQVTAATGIPAENDETPS